MGLFEEILKSRGLINQQKIEDFLSPKYENGHDPYLLPDMEKAVLRLKTARQKQQKVVIYGDYDIDGLTATTLLLDAFSSFGFEKVIAYIPNRFIEGYGLTKDAIDNIKQMKADLIVTVDCGSLSEAEIIYSNSLGIDIIITDHHNVAKVQPPAVAVINPKRLLQDFPDEYENYILKSGNKEIYPFLDLPGVGVAFKLVQAVQKEISGLEMGQEKWLLDLVALGTVCDVVNLTDENRIHVFWGLKVLAKTRRKGLKALLAVSGIDDEEVLAEHLGFGLGPRMNASGRLETAEYTLKMLTANEKTDALLWAEKLDVMNAERKKIQKEILDEALKQAEKMEKDRVLVVSAKDWSHGIIGIVAARLVEIFKKPSYVLEEMGDGEAKGSARSFGDFSVADGIRVSDDIITKGGGHKLAAGVSLPIENIAKFRECVNNFYDELGLDPEEERKKILPKADVSVANLSDISLDEFNKIQTLQPFGNFNPEPVLVAKNVTVQKVRKLGSEEQHLKITVADKKGSEIELISFNAPIEWFVSEGEMINIWFSLTKNEWRGFVKIEGRILHLQKM